MRAAMIYLAVVFGVLAVGMVLVVYGTIVKNRWGVNLAAVSCPSCGTPLARVRKPQSLRQAMWGGYTCPACGAEVDKWGRVVVPVAKIQNSSSSRLMPKGPPNTLFGRLGEFSAMTWAFGGILLALNIWYDFYHLGGFVIDGIILVLLFAWLRKSRNEANHK
jgi:predicted RNA-binding Zn-ribbon protein involved in translation (DUF1610 family)